MFPKISSWAVKSGRDFLTTSLVAIGLVLAVGEPVVAAEAQSKKPLHVLLITGGCCHNYTFQTQALKEAVAKMAQADWVAVINTNLNGLFCVTKAALDDMIERGWGRIINISSVNGQKGQVGQTNYAAAKAGVHGFTMSLAREVAHRNVTVNTVSPGYIETGMMAGLRPDVLDRILDSIPVKRLGKPEEVASIVAWLASDDAAFATGADFPLNGGMHMF